MMGRDGPGGGGGFEPTIDDIVQLRKNGGRKILNLKILYN